jgi:hypothetical protein
MSDHERERERERKSWTSWRTWRVGGEVTEVHHMGGVRCTCCERVYEGESTVAETGVRPEERERKSYQVNYFFNIFFHFFFKKLFYKEMKSLHIQREK